jgi:hypothetical protein
LGCLKGFEPLVTGATFQRVNRFATDTTKAIVAGTSPGTRTWICRIKSPVLCAVKLATRSFGWKGWARTNMRHINSVFTYLWCTFQQVEWHPVNQSVRGAVTRLLFGMPGFTRSRHPLNCTTPLPERLGLKHSPLSLARVHRHLQPN